MGVRQTITITCDAVIPAVGELAYPGIRFLACDRQIEDDASGGETLPTERIMRARARDLGWLHSTKRGYMCPEHRGGEHRSFEEDGPWNN